MLISCTSCHAEHFPGATFCPSCGNHLLQTHDPLVDRIVGKYKIERRVGDGGCSSVYQARHIDSGKSYAVKILLPQFSSNEEMIERFRREAHVLSELQHENIVELFDFGWVSGLGFYLAMEWLDGATVKDYIIQQGPMEKEVVLYLFAQLLDALNTAHQKGIIHRDLKLENLMLVRGGFGRTILKVLDFGIAHIRRDGQSRLTSTGLMVGTPRYMAPEQVRGDNHAIDNRTDLYSCGLMLLEMLTGQPAFWKETVQQLLYSQLEETPPFLQELYPAGQFGEALEQVVRHATEKSPNARYPSAFAFYEALEEAMEAQGVKLCGHLSLQLSSATAAPSFVSLPRPSLHSHEMASTPEQPVLREPPLYTPILTAQHPHDLHPHHTHSQEQAEALLSLPDTTFFSTPSITDGSAESLQSHASPVFPSVSFFSAPLAQSALTASHWIDDHIDPLSTHAVPSENLAVPTEPSQHLHHAAEHLPTHRISFDELAAMASSEIVSQEETHCEIRAIPDSNPHLPQITTNSPSPTTPDHTAPQIHAPTTPSLADLASTPHQGKTLSHSELLAASVGTSVAVTIPPLLPSPPPSTSIDSLDWQLASWHPTPNHSKPPLKIIKISGLVLLWILVILGLIKLLWF